MLIGLIIGLASCKIENQNAGDSSLIGKWQQVKLRTYEKSYSGAVSNDTTYLSAAFDTTDYALFNSNGSCVLSNHYSYSPTTANLSGGTSYYVTKESYDYLPAGSKYILTLQTTLIYPSGFVTTDTLSLSGGGMIIHSTVDNHQFYTIYDGYYSK